MNVIVLKVNIILSEDKHISREIDWKILYKEENVDQQWSSVKKRVV